MLNIISLIIRFRYLFLSGAFLLSFGVVYMKGRIDGYDKKESEIARQENRDRSALDSIRNRNIDDDDLLNILRNGTY